jgi:hypothetical protein
VPDQELLLSLLPEDGTAIAYDALRIALSEQLRQEFAGDEFDRLIWMLGDQVSWDPGTRRIWRRPKAEHFQLPQEIKKEQDLEGWFERFLRKRAAKMFYDPLPATLNFVVQNTARISGSGGRWTRPDLCMACISRYHYTPTPHFDLFSFELKMPSGCNVLAVHEALAHTAAAHFGYLAVYLPAGSKEEANLPAMVEGARRHGVGIIRFTDPMDEASYALVLYAQRHTPAPSKIDGFIEDRFDEGTKIDLRNWVRQ